MHNVISAMEFFLTMPLIRATHKSQSCLVVEEPFFKLSVR